MEQFLLSRLELRKKRLEEHIKGAHDLLEEYRTGAAILSRDVVKCQMSLKQSIKGVQTDMDQYVAAGNIDTNLLNIIVENQMKGEDLIIELELIVNLCSNNSENKEAGARTTVRLPKLELPKFNGDVLRWTEFWDLFEANVHSQNLKPVEKLAYLLSSLEDKAKEAVEGLSVTNNNYEVAVETLKIRYGDKNKVIDSHYEALSRLRRSDYTALNCRRNLNEINKHLRVLTSLGENEESNHLRSLIMEKFPDKVLYELNLLTANDQSVSSIRSTLDTIVGAMERAQVHTEPIATPSASTEAFHIGTRRPIFHKGKRLLSRQTNNKVQKPVDIGPRKRPAANNHNMATKRMKRACIFCEGDHYNDECTVVQGNEDRQKKLVGRCFKCLKEGHRASKCTRNNKCYHCKGNHNRALCPKRKTQGKIHVNSFTTNPMSKCSKVKSFLQTASGQVVHNNKTVNCRLLLDSGSSRSYITTGLAKHLDLTLDNTDLLLIFTFGTEKAKETLSPCSDVLIKTKRGKERSIHVNVVPHITSRIPIPKIPKANLVDILADSGVNEDQRIDMLIGNDYYYSFMRNKTIQIDKDLFLVDTDFGWVVSGHLDEENQGDNILTVATYHQSSKECTCYMQPDLPLRQSDIKFLWSLENIGITDSVKATREEDAVQHFNNTVLYHEGRYYVKWPWTTYPPQLPTNYGLAYGRLKGLLQRMDQSTLKEYNDIIMEQLKAEIIEVLQIDSEVSSQSVPPIHYIAHHIVRQNGKRGRIVFDASARVQDQLSLNECLYRGPCMLQDLTALLLNFRLHRVGITADVEKAYLQVGLQEEDREVTRFLWVKDITKPISNGNLLHLRFCRVPFGIISSAFLLTATIRYHVSKKNSDLLRDVANKCYVDNLVTGTNSTTEALQLFHETRNAFEELSMNLRDWASNDDSFTQMVPESCKAKEAIEMKVLGLMWNKKEDVLTLNMSEELLSEDSPKKVTKREVLKTLASVYDPCGIVTPVLMPIKLFLQELWRKDYKWDAPISSDLLLKWKQIKGQLRKIKGVKIPRYAVANTNERTENELHCFTDAGKDSYAAIAYLRSSDGSKVSISFLMAKGRIVPLEREKKTGHKDVKKDKRKLTIPQLELLGCVIGNRLLTYLKETLELTITRRYLWTDSLVVLSWIHSNKLLPPFVANRVEEIKRNTDVETCYVNTKHNPADIATRPDLWMQKRDMWLRGPTFLSKGKDQWPKDMDLRSHQHQASFSAVAEGLDIQYPDYIPLEMARDEKQEQVSDVDIDIDEPEPEQRPVYSKAKEITDLQRKYYPEETKGKQTSLSRNLGLFTDIDGLLRCKGRMMNANWSFDMKHPILLPRACTFTKNIIKETHEKNYHVGPSHTLSLIRQQYWIPKGRPIVERMIRKCPQCVKHGGGPYALPPPPALPAERANYSPPFTYTGLDYFGPVYVNTENGQQKRWVCLLTCLAVRAVHMEVVKNLTAEECMMALRRFMSTRGVPSVIVSDNAQYFKLSSEVLGSEHCVNNNIRWKFIPQLAPWHGAFYERLVGLVKNCMKRTLEKRLLNDTQILTVIKEIEAVINSRPLTRVGPDMSIVLRPCDFLSLGNCLNLEISENYTEPTDTHVKRSLMDGWKRGQNMLNQFKNMFVNQYLMNLRERYQHAPKQPRVKSHKEPRVGDLVQIKGEAKNRINWKVGKIINLVPSSDGHYRVAQVRVGDSTFTRSIGHLYPLELEEPLSPQAEVIEDQEVQLKVPDTVPYEPQTVRALEPVQENEQIRNSTENMETSETASRVTEEEGNEEASEREAPVIPQPMLVDCAETPPIPEGDVCEDTAVQDEIHTRDAGVKRTAAIRAREKIAEWTRQLFVTL